MRHPTGRSAATPRSIVLGLTGVLVVSSVLAGTAVAGNGDAAAPSGDAAKTRALSGFDNTVMLGPGAPPVTMSLDVPAGKYAVDAKLTARLVGGASEETVDCRLMVADGFDDSVVTISQLLNLQTMALQVVDELAGPGEIRMTCDKSKEASTVELRMVKITALKVGSIAVGPLDID